MTLKTVSIFCMMPSVVKITPVQKPFNCCLFSINIVHQISFLFCVSFDDLFRFVKRKLQQKMAVQL